MCERLIEVGPNVLWIFKTNRQANEAIVDAHFLTDLRWHRRVRHARRVLDKRVRFAKGHCTLAQLKVIHELGTCMISTFDDKANDGARPGHL
jgi:hypothetical protein